MKIGSCAPGGCVGENGDIEWSTVFGNVPSGPIGALLVGRLTCELLGREAITLLPDGELRHTSCIVDPAGLGALVPECNGSRPNSSLWMGSTKGSRLEGMRVRLDIKLSGLCIGYGDSLGSASKVEGSAAVITLDIPFESIASCGVLCILDVAEAVNEVGTGANIGLTASVSRLWLKGGFCGSGRSPTEANSNKMSLDPV